MFLLSQWCQGYEASDTCGALLKVLHFSTYNGMKDSNLSQGCKKRSLKHPHLFLGSDGPDETCVGHRLLTLIYYIGTVRKKLPVMWPMALLQTHFQSLKTYSI